MLPLFSLPRFCFTIFALLIAGTVAVVAKDPVNANWRGLAIKGYDPVAYFEVGEAQAGSGDHELEWQGATWRFVSAAHKAKFAANPENYAPQYGGYCAWAVSNNYTAPIDPKAWKIVDGKLYLNYNHKVQADWEKEMAANIRKADGFWPTLRDE
ncbi:MAG: YHS domain-containing (seleno)protein [Synoicihabitans sp.]